MVAFNGVRRSVKYQIGIIFSGMTGMRGGMNHNSRAQFIVVIRSLWNRCSPLRRV